MKRRFLSWFLVIVFFLLQYFWYGTQYLSISEIPELCKEYGMEGLSNEWRVEKHTKNTLINWKEPMIHFRNIIALFPNETAIVNLYVTHGDDLIETSFPFSPYELASKAMIKEEVTVNGIVIHVEVITPSENVESYTPTYKLTFSNNGNLYRIQFYISGEEAHQYAINEKKIHFDVFNEYLEYAIGLIDF